MLCRKVAQNPSFLSTYLSGCKAIPRIPENLSPVRLAYYLLRSTGVMNKEGRPWSILLTVYHVIMVCSVILGSALEVFLGTADIVDAVPALSVSTGSSHIFSKGMNVLLNQTQILRLMNKLEELRREILQDDENSHFVLKTDCILRKIVTYTMAFFLCFPFISLAMNFISEHFSDSDMPHFIIPMWVPWKVYNSWIHSATLLWMVFLLLSVVAYYVSTTTLTLTISFQLTAFLKVIRARLEKHGPRDKSIFRHHSEIIQLVHSYNEIFSGQLYYEILISSLQPCGFGYALLKAIKRNDPTTLDLVYKTLITIVAPFFVCACGQMISTQMEKLHESAFMGPWYNEKSKVRRNLLQMMTVTVKPVTWNYRGIVIFNMICFATIHNFSPVSLAYHTLRFSGLMNQESRPWSLVICIYHLVIMNCMGLASGIELFSGNGTLPEMIQAMSAFTIYLHVNAKAVNVLRCQTEIRQLLVRLEEIRFGLLQDIDNRHHLIQSDKFLSKLIFSYGSLFLSYPFLALIMNFIVDYTSSSEKPHLVLQVWIPWSMKEFWPYIIGMVAVMFLTLTALIYYVSFSVLLYTFSFQMSAFLKILQARLMQARNGPSDANLYGFHAEIIRLLKTFNQLFSGQLYLETILSSLQPCGFGFALIKAFKRKDPGALDLIYKSFMAVLAPFIVCACGQMISTQVEKLHECSYMSHWYEKKPKIRNNLLTLMSVTVRPTTLNYRMFTVFDYTCFAMVAQGIYSYLMMIINLETDH